MPAWKRAWQGALGVEAALAFGAAAAFFALVGVTVAVVDSQVLVVALGVIYAVAIVAIFRFWGVGYAVPAAMAGLLAYDWFEFAPTHPLEFPDTEILGDLLVYLAVAVLIGQLAAYSVRRAALSEARVARLADEQAALRQVATLVARGVPPPEVFAAVAREAGRLLGVDAIHLGRYERDGSATIGVASWSRAGEHHPVGTRAPLGGKNVATLVWGSGRSARVDRYNAAGGSVGAKLREVGLRGSVGAPIVVDRQLWGVMIASSKEGRPLPVDTESRIAAFTELVATAISNAQARVELSRLAEEQAALRRVATLVARDASQEEVFAAIAEEIGQLLGTEEIRMVRYEGDRSAVVVGGWGEHEDILPADSRLPLEGEDAVSRVFRTGQPARIDDYETASGPIAQPVRSIGIRSVVATPIVVEGQVWGAMVAGTTQNEPLPPVTESRLGQFTELMASAIANAESHARANRLADEQAALRRVATLVAQGVRPAAVFHAVAAEMGQLLGADGVTLSRYEPGAEVTVVAHRGSNASRVPAGSRVSHEGENVTTRVRGSERPARMEHYEGTHGAIAQLVRDLGVRASVGTPIVVDGRLWGVAIANWRGEESPPPETEERMAQFAALLDAAIANADSRDQLIASRVRLVAAGDEARRRVVRDLHDGAQQRLVHTIVTLKLAQRALRAGDTTAESLVAEAREHAEHGNAELRELAHGLLPAVLTHGGLRAGVEAVVPRLDLPVQVDVPAERFPAEIEASAYFIVAEALTNVVKHANAGRAEVRASVEDSTLHIEVRDDGIGGADAGGHGLVGIADRATALGGRVRIENPADGGTLVAATLPLSAN